jgi:hypothetical protein
LTCYPRAFDIIDFDEKNFEKKHFEDKNTHALVLREDGVFKRGYFSSQIGIPTNVNEPLHGFLIAAGCLFTSGEFIKDVPYDPNYYFYGEETSIALRAFTNGYSIFHVPDMPIFHLYNHTDTKIKRPLHWDEQEEKDREIKWWQLEKNGIDRLEKLIEYRLDDGFCLGTKRNLNDYQLISGIDFQTKTLSNKEQALRSQVLRAIDWKECPLNHT